MAKKSSAASKGVSFIRREVDTMLPAYYMIRDVCNGEQAVKGKIYVVPGINGFENIRINPNYLQTTQVYLPMPNPTDLSQENLQRYTQYVQRAVFYNATGRTLAGLLGQVFLRAPQYQLPSQLSVLEKDADGTGITLEDFARRCVSACIQYGRGGILADYPPTQGPTSVADIENNKLRPTLTVYQPWNIINWRTITIGAEKVLSLVVLSEEYEDYSNEFEVKMKIQYRVLKLDESSRIHTVEIHRENPNGGGFQVDETFVPLQSNGKPFDYIPFTFFGAENNDVSVDKPPLYDLASLNIGHYRNSADYEESCYIVGQPTPYFAGLTQDWVESVFKGKVQLGSRAAVPLPEGGSAGLLQAEANTMPMEAMKHKEEQMIALGARLVEIASATKTATEVVADDVAESCVLSNCAKNVGSAISKALGWAGTYVGITATVDYELNTEYDINKMSFQDRAELIAEWQHGAITFEEMRAQLQKAGVATLGDAEAKAAIQKEQAQQAQDAVKQAAALAAATAPTNPPPSNGGNSSGQ